MSRAKQERPRWIGVGARVFAFTLFSTLLALAIALLLSIVGTVIYAQIQHVSPNLVFAYKHIALPIAISCGAVALIVTMVVEVRNYRQGKVLAAIERTAMNR